ncbi:MAG: Phosphoserine phosphatase RsbP [Planctomycetota bacterium]|jgi:serine phosphatase RsbU (regulator of sigma subunit)
MGTLRPTFRIAILSPTATAAEASEWRDRIEAGIPRASVFHLPVESLANADGSPVHLDADIAILFAPDSQGEADAEIDALLRAVEKGANDPNASTSARVIEVGDAMRLRAPRSGADFVPRADADHELLPYLRGALASAQALRQARREVALLGRVIDSMGSELEERNEELQLAALVQKDFLPMPIEPLHGVRVTTLYRPLAQVSGDVYHIEQLDDDRIAVFLADAVGHGIPAALLGMAICRSLETSERVNGQLELLGPAETLARLNARLVEHQRATTRFATAIAAQIDCRKRTMRLAVAGHPPAILLRPGEPPQTIPAEGSLLGVFAGERYDEYEFDLQPNDRLLLYSDGFEQAFSTEGRAEHLEEFGALAGVLDPEELVRRVALGVDRHSGSLHQQDDLTLLCVSVEQCASMRSAA